MIPVAYEDSHWCVEGFDRFEPIKLSALGGVLAPITRMPDVGLLLEKVPELTVVIIWRTVASTDPRRWIN